MLQNCSIYNILEIFFNEPTKSHYLIEISRKSKLAHTSVKKYLLALKKDNLIIESIEKKGKRKFPNYIANLENPNFRRTKQLFNLDKIYNSNLIESLKDKSMPKSIVLSGSYSRGEDIEDSDIDLFIESNKIDVDISKYEKALNRKIQLHFNEKFDNYPIELKNNIINGILLYGYLDAVK